MIPLPPLREPYHSRSRQFEADTLGLYVFLATEVMMFGGLFIVILSYRALHWHQFVAGSERLNLMFGSVNSGILLTSSLLVTLGVAAARSGPRQRPQWYLLAAALLGCAFLVVKGLEYRDDYEHNLLPGVPGARGFADMFFSIYYISTALHAVHLTVGIALMSWLITRISRRPTPWARRAVEVELAGLYWHFVDIVWIFLFPALYLARF